MHKWGGLALRIGVLIHLLLHWRWTLRMTQRTLGFGPRKGREIERERKRGKGQGAITGRERVKGHPWTTDDGEQSLYLPSSVVRVLSYRFS